MNDGSSSLTRLLANSTQDFFRQAVIDNILGVNLNSYEEFSTRLASSDPSDVKRLAKISEAAIETSALMVIAGKLFLFQCSPTPELIVVPFWQTQARFNLEDGRF